MKIIIIAALSKNRVIGRDNAIPWHYPADMKHFRRVTRGHAVVAGRKTYETFQTRPLPQRLNFVLTLVRDGERD
ncbi:MAG: dihydrofolate reductase, partial [Gemmatimonadota bacterium]|nr:dihydrofolate reductase [Gemmatimonadota bacterium]